LPLFFIPSPHAFYYVDVMTCEANIYLDHAAGTFVLPEVQEQINKILNDEVVNPSSIHARGRLTAALLDSARQDTAGVIGAKPGEIIFTSGGTEANNLAIFGLAHAQKNKGKHILSCQTEHPSVLASLKQLENEGFRVSYLSTNSHGEIDLDNLAASISDETILISLMWINNETGLIHPIEEIGGIAKDHDIRFHCDAVQALGHIPIQTDKLPVDALTFSGHKIGAPAGIGVLYLRKGIVLQHQSYGGNQENNLRAGTQNVIGAQSFSRAAQYFQDHFEMNKNKFQTQMTGLREKLKRIPGIQFNRGGSLYSDHILNCSFQQVDGEALFIRLDMRKIAVSNGSACSSGSQAPSHVLTSLGMEESLAQASLRISLGINTSESEIEQFCKELNSIINSIKSAL